LRIKSLTASFLQSLLNFSPLCFKFVLKLVFVHKLLSELIHLLTMLRHVGLKSGKLLTHLLLVCSQLVDLPSQAHDGFVPCLQDRLLGTHKLVGK